MTRTLIVTAALLAVVAGVFAALLTSGGPGHPAGHLHHWNRPVRGITLADLQHQVLTPGSMIAIDAKIAAAAGTWHMNTVRIHVTQDRLVGADGRHYNPVYMGYVKATVDQVRAAGMTAVINPQTEWTAGYKAQEPLPTVATHAFWRHIMGVYANAPRVIFDLFNEPRHCSWDAWRAAHQPLVNEIRGAHARNTIWAEGRNWASTLDGVPLLAGKGIVYTFHHPGAPWPGMANNDPAAWDKAFGDLAYRVPVIDGEFANFAKSYAWHPMAASVTRYFAYLAAHHIGLVMYGFQAGMLNATTDARSVTHAPVGCGALARRYFAAGRA